MPTSSYQIVLTSSPDGPITAYDASSGNTLARFSGSRSPRHGLTLVGKSYMAASHISLATGAGYIQLYNWYSPTAAHNVPVPEPVAPLVATRDGSFVLAGSISGAIHVILVPCGDIIRSFHAHERSVSCLRINQDESVLISGGEDGNIVVIPIFQLVAESCGTMSNDFIFHKLCAHEAPVTDIACCSLTFMSCSLDSTCKIWSLLNGTHVQKLQLSCPVLGITVDPAETHFYAAGSDGFIHMGSLNFSRKAKPKNQNLCNLVKLGQRHNSAVVSLIMANEGKTLLSAAEDGTLFNWDTGTGQVTMVFGNSEIGNSISDMVIASALGDNSNRHRLRFGNGDVDELSCGVFDFGFSGNFLDLKDKLDLENVFSVAEKDKSRAIDMLESAIAVYERLLELILKEAQRGTRNSGVRETVEREKD